MANHTVFIGPKVPSKKRVVGAGALLGAAGAIGTLAGGGHPAHALSVGATTGAFSTGAGFAVRSYRKHQWNKALAQHKSHFNSSVTHHGRVR